MLDENGKIWCDHCGREKTNAGMPVGVASLCEACAWRKTPLDGFLRIHFGRWLAAIETFDANIGSPQPVHQLFLEAGQILIESELEWVAWASLAPTAGMKPSTDRLRSECDKWMDVCNLIGEAAFDKNASTPFPTLQTVRVALNGLIEAMNAASETWLRIPAQRRANMKHTKFAKVVVKQKGGAGRIAWQAATGRSSK